MNPYEVLGVSPNADEETIKKAYKELVKKYHPDRYINNPLADLAAEKMKEINKAYDMITNKTPTSGGYENTYNRGYSSQNSGATGFSGVRSLISQGRILEAQTMLNSLPKTAEWYYLNGIICIRCGWYDRALTSLRQACTMEPGNVEYRAALDNITNRNTSYTTGSSSSSGCYCCPCDPCCGTLACMNCFCC